ncbi:MAG: hypothetical protein H6Q00_1430 [Holophagaceae bacterium]|nr:hypothetical protein [Holophagaceae bacterium]
MAYSSHSPSNPTPEPLPGPRASEASISKQLEARIRRQSKAYPERVFTPSDFSDLGSPHSVGMALMRLVRTGALRHLARGLYDVPRTHPLLGELLPTAEAIAQALARRDGATLLPMEAMAANLLGLSEQVPAKAVFLTDGPDRLVTIGPLTVQLRQRPVKQVSKPAPTSSLVFAALRSLGKEHVSLERVSHLQETLSAKDRKRLMKDLPLAPAWMHPFLRHIAGEKP